VEVGGAGTRDEGGAGVLAVEGGEEGLDVEAGEGAGGS